MATHSSRVSIHSPNDLSRGGPAVTWGALGLGATQMDLRVGLAPI